MKKEFKIIEKFNPTAKTAEEKLQEIFISYLTEKLINPQSENIQNIQKYIEKSYK